MKYTKRRPRIRTKNHTAAALRPKYKNLPLYPFSVLVRLGSTTEKPEDNFDLVVNPINGIRNSSHKLKMKEAFRTNNVYQSIWYTIKNNTLLLEGKKADLDDIQYPLLAKQIFGKKGEGMQKLDDKEQLQAFLSGNTKGYFIEKFYNFGKEYRIHTSVSTDCFYTNRKVRRRDSEEKYFFNSTNCNWLLETNPEFDKPNNWNTVVEHAKAALKSVGLHFGAVDIRIQNNTTAKGKRREAPEFIVCEINSAPAFGEGTEQCYLNEIPKIINTLRDENR